MKAVILAAGDGSRLESNHGKPKALLELAGQTLLERSLASLSKLGIQDFVVVIGYKAELVEAFIKERRLEERYKITLVVNERWPEGNAISVLAARDFVHERFLAAMGDHLFDPQRMRGLLSLPGEFVGAFDSSPRYIDIAEATKAAGDLGSVERVGKELEEFNYIDAGLFVCSERIFPVIERCLAQGRDEWNDVKEEWIKDRELHIYDLKGGFWLDIDTDEDRLTAERLLHQRLGGKGKRVRRAVILAPSEGSLEKPTMLTKLCGRSLLERNLRLLKALDIRKVTIIVGPRGKPIKQYLDKKSGLGMKIGYVEGGDGWSPPMVGGEFLLLEGDRLFDARIIEALLDRGEATLAIDGRIDKARGLPKVLIEESVKAIGKNLEEWDGVYIGAALCTPQLLRILLDDSPQAGDRLESLGIGYLDISEIPTYIAEMRRDLPIFWIRVENERDLERAKKLLIERTQKGTLDVLAWYLHRPLENRITYYLAEWPITPNQVTIFTNLVAYFATFLFLQGYLLWASLLTLAVNILDGVDGKLARARGVTTKLGHIEHSFDLLFEQSWYIAFAWHIFSRSGSLLPLILGLLILLLDSFNRHCSMQFKQVMGVSLADYARFDRLFRRFDGRRNIYTLYMLAGAIFGFPLFALMVMAAHAFLTAVVYASRAIKHLRAADCQSAA
jgi:choline kinase/phosphatidylglycerophosphate synthase